MAIESDTERAIFFDTDDFAKSATFADVSAGTSSTVKGIFDKESVEQSVGEAGLIEEVPFFFKEKVIEFSHGVKWNNACKEPKYPVSCEHLDGHFIFVKMLIELRKFFFEQYLNGSSMLAYPFEITFVIISQLVLFNYAYEEPESDIWFNTVVH